MFLHYSILLLVRFSIVCYEINVFNWILSATVYIFLCLSMWQDQLLYCLITCCLLTVLLLCLSMWQDQLCVLLDDCVACFQFICYAITNILLSSFLVTDCVPISLLAFFVVVVDIL